MIKILLADDHLMVLSGLKSMLEKEAKFEIVGDASNGQDVLDLLSGTIEPDIILADINMPGIGGLDLTKQIKERFPGIKVIILSALDHEKIISQALKAGANGYLLKNSSPEELIFAIKHIHKYEQYICEDITSKLVKRMLAMPDFMPLKQDYQTDFSERDIEILSLVAEGFTNQEIADKLFTSKRTVENHRQQLIDRTGSRNTAALIRFAMLNGVI